jgi:hypothetical protein
LLQSNDLFEWIGEWGCPMRRGRPELRVIQGRSAKRERGDKIALSLVHPRERVDIPMSAVVSIKAGPRAIS